MHITKYLKSEVLIAFLILFSMSGCTTSSNYHTITIGSGGMTIEDGTFYLQGNVSIGVGAQPDINLSNVHVNLYSEDREIIKSIKIGSLSTNPNYSPLEQDIDITTKRIPEYVLIESPEFWGESANIRIFAYQKTSNGYEEYYRPQKSQKFPEEDQ